MQRASGVPHALNARLDVIASAAKQSISPRKERMDCFASLAMTALHLNYRGCLKFESVNEWSERFRSGLVRPSRS